MGDISQHFSRHELDCHDGTPVPAELWPALSRLVCGVLEPIRAELRLPIVVLSGYRSPSYNATIPGAAPDSRHCHADAADIVCRGYDTGDTKLWSLIRHLWSVGALPGLGGLGRYANRVHVDARPHAVGVLAEWDYR
jgi:uncharacterized protein YcbK (DUF882 family)